MNNLVEDFQILLIFQQFVLPSCDVIKQNESEVNQFNFHFSY